MSSIDETTTEIERQSSKPKILVVDDESMIRNLAKDVLEMLGYGVETAPDGATALRLYLEGKSRFGLVITDNDMPGMKGIQLAGEIRANGNGVPIVISSGKYVGGAELLRQAGVSDVLPKPYRISQLQACVEQHYKGR